MNIRLAWNFDIRAYKSLFPEIELFNWEKDSNIKIDLMVFPGGEDVSLNYYLDPENIRRYSDLCYSNAERDIYEGNILDACYDGRLNVKKIFGVCRGMQFINVMFDGKLYPDLYSSNLGHNSIHEIVHSNKNELDFITTVNSMHHQGLSKLGPYNRRGNRCNPMVLATDNTGLVPEIIGWEGGRILGVQFHPEYFWDDDPNKKKFSELMYSWVKNERSIY